VLVMTSSFHRLVWWIKRQPRRLAGGAMGGLPVGTLMQMGDPLPDDGRRTALGASASRGPESSLRENGNVREGASP